MAAQQGTQRKKNQPKKALPQKSKNNSALKRKKTTNNNKKTRGEMIVDEENRRHSTGTIGIKRKGGANANKLKPALVDLDVNKMIERTKSDMDNTLKAVIHAVKRSNSQKITNVQEQFEQKKERLESLVQDKSAKQFMSTAEADFDREKQSIMAIVQNIRQCQRKAATALKQNEDYLRKILMTTVKSHSAMIKREISAFNK